MLAADKLKFGAIAGRLDRKSGGNLRRAAKAAGFEGRQESTLEVLAPSGLGLERVIVVGAGNPGTGSSAGADDGRLLLGGQIYGAVEKAELDAATAVLELPKKTLDGRNVADIALGMLLRSYAFKKYKTDAGGDATGNKASGNKGKRRKASKTRRLVVACKSPKAAERAFKASRAIAEGVFLARDLVNEPANNLGPVEFAERAEALRELGVEVDILDEARLEAEKMGALLAVGQGSARPPRVAVMRWQGAPSPRAKPIAFVGKGVVFDTGGISLKPAKGMEDMKGDMGGAAAVIGTMHALARRKAKVNAVGIVGLVENMPSAKATRPGDIVTSMSGQTIEVLNTDAEGRLVLADLLHYVQTYHKPKAVIDLATLTGAIMVALGQEYAGLFANDDRLAARIEAAGRATGERVWRMPLGAAYDKQLRSQFADMRNIGSRWGGAITAAQFLKRFVDDKTPWAHIDIAGTAMASKRNAINRSWGSGFGVRLLDRLVRDTYE